MTDSPKEKPRSALWTVVRVVVTIAALAGLVRFVHPDELLAAVRRIPASALALCMVAVFVGQMFAALRFQLLLVTYGADRPLSFLTSLRLLLVATFYNTFLPGALTGDVIRAVSVRACFAEGGLTSALAVGLVERITGFAGLLILTASVAAVRPIPGIEGLLLFSLLGLAAAASAIGAIVVGRRIAARLPARLATLAHRLPQIRDMRAFVAVLACAVVNHTCGAVGFHAIIRSLSAHASLAESLVIVPLASSATYIPATIAGAGTRDAAFVLLYGRVGVNVADAMAMSLAALFSTLVVAGLGGIINLITPQSPR